MSRPGLLNRRQWWVVRPVLWVMHRRDVTFKTDRQWAVERRLWLWSGAVERPRLER